MLNKLWKLMEQEYERVILKNCAPFIDCISEINNTQTDNAKDLDVVMPMCNLIECSNNYSKTSGSPWKYYRDDPPNTTKDSELFKSKIKITGNTADDNDTKNFATAVPLK